jgi:hypothetical protein
VAVVDNFRTVEQMLVMLVDLVADAVVETTVHL